MTEIVMECNICGVTFRMDRSKWNGMCPKADKVGHMISYRHCTRCGYSWTTPNPAVLARTCANPACRTYLWNRERTKGVRK